MEFNGGTLVVHILDGYWPVTSTTFRLLSSVWARLMCSTGTRVNRNEAHLLDEKLSTGPNNRTNHVPPHTVNPNSIIVRMLVHVSGNLSLCIVEAVLLSRFRQKNYGLHPLSHLLNVLPSKRALLEELPRIWAVRVNGLEHIYILNQAMTLYTAWFTPKVGTFTQVLWSAPSIK